MPNKQFKVCAVIAAAGKSSRMNIAEEMSKQFIEINGKTVIEKTITVFDSCCYIDEIIVVARLEDIEKIREIVENAGLRHGFSKCRNAFGERQHALREQARRLLFRQYPAVSAHKHDGAEHDGRPHHAGGQRAPAGQFQPKKGPRKQQHVDHNDCAVEQYQFSSALWFHGFSFFHSSAPVAPPLYPLWMGFANTQYASLSVRYCNRVHPGICLGHAATRYSIQQALRC